MGIGARHLAGTHLIGPRGARVRRDLRHVRRFRKVQEGRHVLSRIDREKTKMRVGDALVLFGAAWLLWQQQQVEGLACETWTSPEECEGRVDSGYWCGWHAERQVCRQEERMPPDSFGITTVEDAEPEEEEMAPAPMLPPDRKECEEWKDPEACERGTNGSFDCKWNDLEEACTEDTNDDGDEDQQATSFDGRGPYGGSNQAQRIDLSFIATFSIVFGAFHMLPNGYD